MLKLLTALVAMAAAPMAHAKDPGVITGGIGTYDLVGHRNTSVEGKLSYRFGWAIAPTEGAFRGFHPIIGGMIAGNKSSYGYAGLAAPFQWGRFEVEPSLGMGAYHRGNGLELGGTFEFHLGLGLSYAVTEHVRVGAVLDHISNAQTHEVNPGLNSLLGTVAFTFP